jgi:hypothetical protein
MSNRFKTILKGYSIALNSTDFDLTDGGSVELAHGATLLEELRDAAGYTDAFNVAGDRTTLVFDAQASLHDAGLTVELKGEDGSPLVAADPLFGTETLWQGLVKLQTHASVDRFELDTVDTQIQLEASIDRFELDAVDTQIQLEASIDRFELDAVDTQIQLEASIDRFELDAVDTQIQLQASIDRFELDAVDTQIQLQASIDRFELDAVDTQIQLEASIDRFVLDAVDTQIQLEASIDRFELDAVDTQIQLEASIDRFELDAGIAALNGALNAEISDRIAGDTAIELQHSIDMLFVEEAMEGLGDDILFLGDTVAGSIQAIELQHSLDMLAIEAELDDLDLDLTPRFLTELIVSDVTSPAPHMVSAVQGNGTMTDFVDKLNDGEEELYAGKLEVYLNGLKQRVGRKSDIGLEHRIELVDRTVVGYTASDLWVDPAGWAGGGTKPAYFGAGYNADVVVCTDGKLIFTVDLKAEDAATGTFPDVVEIKY